MSEAILGISAYYHDSAAALIVDGEIFAAAQEERFTRQKHVSDFPINAVTYVLDEAGLQLNDLQAVSFYDKPYVKFERLLETYHSMAPRGLKSFRAGIPVWIKEKLLMRHNIRNELDTFEGTCPHMIFPEHHLSHASSAFFPSPFSEAGILTLDGVGEWATAIIASGQDNQIKILKQLDFPHSLGLLYSAFTYYCGFKVNSGEYKLMGLAPYGIPDSKRVLDWKARIYDQLVDIREDGSFLLNMNYFDYLTGLRMCNDEAWGNLFGIPPRKPEDRLDQSYMDLALAIQEVTEEIVHRLAETVKNLTGCSRLVMAGGVALNCVANGKLLRSGLFQDIWVQPASGDAGGALGAALAGWHIWMGRERPPANQDRMKGTLLGPEFSEIEIRRATRKYRAPCRSFDSFQQLCADVAELLAEGKVIGWFQGRMEFGPRALGNRSILGDPRRPEMQKKLNLKVKYREGFRPFAPSVLEEHVSDYFDLDRPSPYMLFVAPVKEKKRYSMPDKLDDLTLYERLYYPRSDIPSVTHMDYSARVHSVSKETNPRFWTLLNSFKELTGFGVLMNTSFNVRSEPIVCSPEDAYRCFMGTEMDCLVMGDFLFKKTEQPQPLDRDHWKSDYEPD